MRKRRSDSNKVRLDADDIPSRQQSFPETIREVSRPGVYLKNTDGTTERKIRLRRGLRLGGGGRRLRRRRGRLLRRDRTWRWPGSGCGRGRIQGPWRTGKGGWW